jgi:CubicO group peptidase (beta-lactamase class C family)
MERRALGAAQQSLRWTLLHHTSGIPDFSQTTAFKHALPASLLKAPPPAKLLSFVEHEGLMFDPGSRYRYSNSDNIVVGLMIQAATRRSYASVLREQVYRSIGLSHTSLPTGAAMPAPLLRGYAVAPGRWAGASRRVQARPGASRRRHSANGFPETVH